MTTETETPAQEAPAKPRGDCTGCKFEYQLGTARTGEFKGQLVIRKHNSRTGPGLCDGAQRPPAGAEPEAMEEGPVPIDLDAFMAPAAAPHPDETDVSSAPQEGKGPWIDALHYGECSSECGERIEPGAIIRADGEGGWEISGCPDNSEPTREGVRTIVTAVAETVGLPQIADRMVDRIEAGLPAMTESQAQTTTMAESAFRFVAWHDPHTHEADSAIAAVDPTIEQCEAQGLHWPSGTPATKPAPVLPGLPAIIDPAMVPTLQRAEGNVVPDQFMAPGAATDIPDGSVSMQPDPDRDRWGRYVFHGKSHTRATTFAKSASNTFTLNEWQQRMVILGLTQRPDLMALAHGLNVRNDKKTLNSIAEQAKEHAGSKVAANLGTAYHAFSERLDAGLITLQDIPEAYRHRVAEYADVMRRAGLTTRREWIERTTAVRADQVSADLGVGGTLDRILQLPDGSLAIGDLKTGRDLQYGWVEIAVQLALYAHGVNTHGLFDWNTKTWSQHIDTPGGMMPLQVRTDFAIVMHMPADISELPEGSPGCRLYRVDIEKGWKYAQVCGRVMAMQKDKTLAYELTVPDEPPAPVIEPTAVYPEPGLTQYRDDMMMARKLFREVRTKEEAAGLYGYAAQSGKFSPGELNDLAAIGMAAIAEPPY